MVLREIRCICFDDNVNNVLKLKNSVLRNRTLLKCFIILNTKFEMPQCLHFTTILIPMNLNIYLKTTSLYWSINNLLNVFFSKNIKQFFYEISGFINVNLDKKERL